MTGKEVLRIEKSGDFGIDVVAFNGQYIAYSDCKETHIFAFDAQQLKLRKLTRRICSHNGLPPVSFLAFHKVEGSE